MKYQLKNGVVLFSVCDAYFIFSSRKSEASLHVLIRVSDELLSVLTNHNDSLNEISDQTSAKIRRLIRMGYIEETQ